MHKKERLREVGPIDCSDTKNRLAGGPGKSKTNRPVPPKNSQSTHITFGLSVESDNLNLRTEMDLAKTLEELRLQKQILMRAIELLESLRGAVTDVPPPKSRRGRKFMGAEERREVSARMKRYWASKRRSK
jgi:hypothetical protein